MADIDKVLGVVMPWKTFHKIISKTCNMSDNIKEHTKIERYSTKHKPFIETQLIPLESWTVTEFHSKVITKAADSQSVAIEEVWSHLACHALDFLKRRSTS